jgi:hypothetical protein
MLAAACRNLHIFAAESELTSMQASNQASKEERDVETEDEKWQKKPPNCLIRIMASRSVKKISIDFKATI